MKIFYRLQICCNEVKGKSTITFFTYVLHFEAFSWIEFKMCSKQNQVENHRTSYLRNCNN